MRFDRVADIPIRHRFTDYVCTVGYSERRDEFRFISVRYADHRKSSAPTNGARLYRRIRKETALRVSLLEALAPNKKAKIQALREKAIDERARRCGLALGLIVLCMLGYVLYRVTFQLAPVAGYDNAEAKTYWPVFLALLVVFPVQHVVAHFYKQLYCGQHGHRLYNFNDEHGRPITSCKRCSFRVVGVVNASERLNVESRLGA
jgi:hypothetical protein